MSVVQIVPAAIMQCKVKFLQLSDWESEVVVVDVPIPVETAAHLLHLVGGLSHSRRV
jgi:hypothetical protein